MNNGTFTIAAIVSAADSHDPWSILDAAIKKHASIDNNPASQAPNSCIGVVMRSGLIGPASTFMSLLQNRRPNAASGAGVSHIAYMSLLAIFSDNRT
jgi:hypothetical protein